MTADELTSAQEKFDKDVWNEAKAQGLVQDGVGPILDGVADEQEYLDNVAKSGMRPPGRR